MIRIIKKITGLRVAVYGDERVSYKDSQGSLRVRITFKDVLNEVREDSIQREQQIQRL